MLRNLRERQRAEVGYGQTTVTHLGIFCVHVVKFDVPLIMRSFEMAER